MESIIVSLLVLSMFFFAMSIYFKKGDYEDDTIELPAFYFKWMGAALLLLFFIAILVYTDNSVYARFEFIGYLGVIISGLQLMIILIIDGLYLFNKTFNQMLKH